VTAREWPDDAVRVWLLRTAADFIKDGNLEEEAQELIRHAVLRSAARANEDGFRCLLATVLAWTGKDINEAVGEVYGEKPTVVFSEDGMYLGKRPSGDVLCERPTDVFLSPGGVEPEEWRTK
jgi:hypothetical protein